MPLVAPGVCRFVVNGKLGSEDCLNLLDVRFTTGTGESRTSVAFEIGGDILNNWTDHILPLLSGVYVANSVSWVDLNSADGATGSRTSTDAQTWPETGGQAVAPLPNSVYAKIAKVLDGKNRAQRNGTLRLSGIPEAYTSGGDGNTLEATPLANINTAFENFKDGINGNGMTPINLVVVHTVGGDYTDDTIIETFQCQAQVGTIRRRMPGYGS